MTIPFAPQKPDIQQMAGYGGSAKGRLARSLGDYATYLEQYSPEESERIRRGVGKYKSDLLFGAKMTDIMGEEGYGRYEKWLGVEAKVQALGGITPTTVQAPYAAEAEKQRRKRRKHYGSTILAGGGLLGVASTRKQILGG